MARYKSRSNKKMKRRSRKQHGGLFGMFSGLGDKIKGLFGSKPDETTTTNTVPPVAETDDTNLNKAAPTEPTGPTGPIQTGGGGRKKTKKRHHRRHRK